MTNTKSNKHNSAWWGVHVIHALYATSGDNYPMHQLW